VVEIGKPSGKVSGNQWKVSGKSGSFRTQIDATPAGGGLTGQPARPAGWLVLVRLYLA